MKINNVEIEETYAEGFGMYASRILITAINLDWALKAASVATGFATSTIHCDCEAGIDSIIPANKTPDGRPGVSVIFCVQNKEKMEMVLLNRIGQCILTCSTTSCFDWMDEEKSKDPKTFEIKTGYKLKFFGDGFEEKSKIDWNGKEINIWKIPTMDGYFIVEDSFKVAKVAGGGNFIVFSNDIENLLKACQSATDKMKNIEGIILPFPCGFVRSPSKIGSLKYSKFLNASINHPLIPLLKSKINDSTVPDGATVGVEFVINGLNEQLVKKAMREGILELVKHKGIIKITAGNYGGKLGKIFYHLKEIVE